MAIVIGRLEIQGVQITVLHDSVNILMQVKRGWFNRTLTIIPEKASQLVNLVLQALEQIKKGGRL